MAAGDAGRLIGRTLGDYTLNALVGIGGMAEVYRAHDNTLGREVAVKVLSPESASDANYRELFRKEARRVAAFDHPNIVPVFYLGEQDGLLYLVMPLMAESLRHRVTRVGRPSNYESVRVVVQIAAALYVAHSYGITHRDVKPENILLNAEGRPLLTDFGIARDGKTTRDLQELPNDPLAAPRRPSQTLARAGLPVGTPEYMAPEQLRMASVDARVDIYALGAVLYELLTGRAPHEAPTPEEVAALTLSAPVVPPSTYNPEIWPELEIAVLTALAYEPSDRYPDARQFAMALLAAVANHPEQRAARITPPQFVPSAPNMHRSSASNQAQQSPPDAGETAPTLRIATPLPAIGRGRLLLFALIILTVAAVIIGSGFLFFGDPSSPHGSMSATQTASSIALNGSPTASGTSGHPASGATSTPIRFRPIPGPPKSSLKPPPKPIILPTPTPTATQTATATATHTATATATHTATATAAATATHTATATATHTTTGTATASSTATSTVVPTDTPVPTATTPPTPVPTPIPPQMLVLTPMNLSLAPGSGCWQVDVQSVYNPDSLDRNWSWGSPSTISTDTLEWSIDQTNWYDAESTPPTNITVQAGQSMGVWVAVDTSVVNGTPTGVCNDTDNSSWAITMTDSAGFTYMIVAQI